LIFIQLYGICPSIQLQEHRIANQVTKGRDSKFTLHLVTSKVPINYSSALTHGLADLSHDSIVKIRLTVFHISRLSKVSVKYDVNSGLQKVLLLSDTLILTLLTLLSYLKQYKFGYMSDIYLWHIIHILNALLHYNQFTHVCRHNLQHGEEQHLPNLVIGFSA
jgi:hypothetical protein